MTKNMKVAYLNNLQYEYMWNVYKKKAGNDQRVQENAKKNDMALCTPHDLC